MGFMREFKQFAMRGNVMDMAVGVIIGGAFGKIVSSFINDVVMPPLGLLLGNADFSDLALTLSVAGRDGKPVVLAYGKFVTTVVDFAILAFAVFLMVRLMNRLKREEPAAPTEKKCPECQLIIPLAATRCGHCAQPLS